MERLILPGKIPSVNHMYRNARIGNRSVRILKKVAKDWLKENTLITQLWASQNKWETTDQKVVLNIWLYYPDGRRRDSHNQLKILMDMLEDAGVYEDDKTALPRIIDYEVDRDNPRVEIEIYLK